MPLPDYQIIDPNLMEIVGKILEPLRDFIDFLYGTRWFFRSIDFYRIDCNDEFFIEFNVKFVNLKAWQIDFMECYTMGKRKEESD
jgi:hypothetical protein